MSFLNIKFKNFDFNFNLKNIKIQRIWFSTRKKIILKKYYNRKVIIKRLQNSYKKETQKILKKKKKIVTHWHATLNIELALVLLEDL